MRPEHDEPNDLDQGRLICEIGVAPLRPAEFVIFRIGQWTADRKGMIRQVLECGRGAAALERRRVQNQGTPDPGRMPLREPGSGFRPESAAGTDGGRPPRRIPAVQWRPPWPWVPGWPRSCSPPIRPNDR